MKLLCCFLEAGAGSALCLQAVPDAVGVAGGPGAVLAVPLLSANPDFCPNASSSGLLSLAAWFAGPASAKRGFRVAGGCPSTGRTGLAFVAVTPVPLLCGGWGGGHKVSWWCGSCWRPVPRCDPCSLAQLQQTPTRHNTGRERRCTRPPGHVGAAFSSSSNSCRPGPHGRVDTAGAQGRREDEEAVTGRAGRPQNSWLLHRCSQWPARRPRQRAHRRP